jgi:transcriptional regulator with XRE-family HTH domain
MKIGDKLSELMVKKKMEAKELSDRSTVSIGYLYKVLNNKSDPSPETIHKLANALECDIEELIEGNKVYYSEPSIFNKLPDDLKEFVVAEENKPYIVFAKQLKRYDLEKMLENISDTDMKFLLSALYLHIQKSSTKE